MNETLIAYFNGERGAAVTLIALTCAGAVAALLLWPERYEQRSFAVTLAVFAAIELAIGVGLYLRTPPQVSALVAQLSSDPARFVTDEGARMIRVQRNFRVIQYAEVAVVILAALVALAFKDRPSIAGVALGLLIHAGLLLAFDIVAERRGVTYLAAIQAGP